MDHLERECPEIAAAIRAELARQNETIELIASENSVPPAILEAQGSILTNKYAEGRPGHRYLSGCEHVDTVESLAIRWARELFGAEHANVQPHSGVNANLAVFLAVLRPGDRMLAMNLAHGGHLSHGYRLSLPGQVYECQHYGVDRDTERLDYEAIRRQALEFRPQLIVAGASAYPRVIDFAAFRRIADEVGAWLMVDMAHIAGLVAGGVHPSPVPHADFVTSTTTKTLAGARGGFVLCRAAFAEAVDRAVFPGLQGGAIYQIVAGKAVCFRRAMSEGFREYARRIVANAQALAAGLMARGFRLVTGGTDNHLMLVDLRDKGLTGAQAERALEAVGIAANKNLIPYDPAPPAVTSGIRLGTAAISSRGLGPEEAAHIAEVIGRVLARPDDAATKEEARAQVRELCQRFPLYGYTFA